MQESAQGAKISGTPPERGHSCPQQLPNTQQDRNVRELYFLSTLLRTRMSALRFGSGSAGLGAARPAMRTVVKPFGFFFYVMVLFCLSGFAAEPPVSCVLRLRG